MGFLIFVLFMFFIFKWLTSWMFYVIPIAFIAYVILWGIYHLALTALAIAILAALYDHFAYQPKHDGKSLFGTK